MRIIGAHRRPPESPASTRDLAENELHNRCTPAACRTTCRVDFEPRWTVIRLRVSIIDVVDEAAQYQFVGTIGPNEPTVYSIHLRYAPWTALSSQRCTRMPTRCVGSYHDVPRARDLGER